MRYTSENSGRTADSRRRLSTILRNLIASDDFRRSETVVEVSQEISMPIKDFFVNFSVVDDSFVNKKLGFWGLIYDTGDGSEGSLWLNTGKKIS
jgi:hypothetical protein